MEEGVLIREVSAEDIRAVTEIFNHYIENSTASFNIKPFTIGEMEERMESIYPEYPYFVAELNGEIVGFCYAHPWKEREAYKHTWESTIYLSPSAVGKGIGERLMRRLIQESPLKGCRVMIACITGGNNASIRLHEKLGFRQVSHFRNVGYKFGNYLDVVDYQLDFPTSGQGTGIL